MNIKIYSFFSGAGFLDLGFEDENYEISFVNEYEKNFLDSYIYSRKEMNYKKPEHGYYQGDINDLFKGKFTKILDNNICSDKKEALVGFIGGPPCPDFSIAGKNEGIIGRNGRLTTSYKRMIIEKKPDFFLFENVKGLWSTKKHREEYEKIKQSFKRKGYILIDRLVNALEYGVPQDRERILLFGIKYDLLSENKKEAKRLLENNFKWNKNAYHVEDIKRLNWPIADAFYVDDEKPLPDNIIKELTIEYWFRKNNVYYHPNALDYFNPISHDKFATIREGDVSKKSFKRLHRWRYSPTAAYGNNEVHLHPYKTRRISVAEALAIQSLPTRFVILPTLSLSHKFKMVGNGVPYLLAKGIANEIHTFLEQNIKEG